MSSQGRGPHTFDGYVEALKQQNKCAELYDALREKQLREGNIPPQPEVAKPAPPPERKVQQHHADVRTTLLVLLAVVLCSMHSMQVAIIQDHTFLVQPNQNLSAYAGCDIGRVMSNRSLLELVWSLQEFNNTLCAELTWNKTLELIGCAANMKHLGSAGVCTKEEAKKIHDKYKNMADYRMCQQERGRIGPVVQEFERQLHKILYGAVFGTETMVVPPVLFFLGLHGMLFSRSYASFWMFVASAAALCVALAVHAMGYPIATLLSSGSFAQFCFGWITNFHKKYNNAAIGILLWNAFTFCLFLHNVWSGSSDLISKVQKGNTGWMQALTYVATDQQTMLPVVSYYLGSLFSGKALHEVHNFSLDVFSVVCSMWILGWWAARYMLHGWMDERILTLDMTDTHADNWVWFMRTVPTLFLTCTWQNLSARVSREGYNIFVDSWYLFSLAVQVVFHFQFSAYMHRLECTVINVWKIVQMHSAVLHSA